jgi:tetratricopeptide (TPR) repeat protein
MDIVHAWEHINYQLPEKQRPDAFAALEKSAAEIAARYPGRAEPLVWEGIVYSSHAGVAGLAALGYAKEARALLLKAESIDPDVLDGSIYTSLGVLYHKVPGWPIGFGDDDKAESYLRKALGADPAGIDANYFWADFEYSRHHYAEALQALSRAESAPARPDRALSDSGRREEIRALRDQLDRKVGERGG